MITIIQSLPQIMATCLIVTIISEIIVALIIGVREKKDLVNIVLVNIITNPLVVIIPIYCNFKYGLLGRNICLYTLEILTVLVEGFIYYKVLKYKKINGFLLSFILNLSSYLIGILTNFIIYGHT